MRDDSDGCVHTRAIHGISCTSNIGFELAARLFYFIEKGGTKGATGGSFSLYKQQRCQMERTLVGSPLTKSVLNDS